MEKEIKKLENSEVEKVSGGLDCKVEKTYVKDLIKEPLPKCPKCGRQMRQSGGYAYIGPDGHLVSRPCRTYCSYCDSKDIDFSKIKKS